MKRKIKYGPGRHVVLPNNVYLIKIHGYVRYMDPDKYVQFASKGPGERFYVNRGAAGGLSISAKRCTILAQGINCYPVSHFAR